MAVVLRASLFWILGLGAVPAALATAVSTAPVPIDREPPLVALEPVEVRGLEGDSGAFQVGAGGTAPLATAPRESATLFEVALAPHREGGLRRLGRRARPLLDDPLLNSRRTAARSVVLLALPDAAHELDAFHVTLSTVQAGSRDWLYLWGVAVDASSIEEAARWLARLRARRDRELSNFSPRVGDAVPLDDRRFPRAVPEPSGLAALAIGLGLLAVGAQRSPEKSSRAARSQSATTTSH